MHHCFAIEYYPHVEKCRIDYVHKTRGKSGAECLDVDIIRPNQKLFIFRVQEIHLISAK